MPIVDTLPETPLAFDNDVFTWLRNKNPEIQARVREHFDANSRFPALPAITLFETRNGIAKGLEKGSIKPESLIFIEKRIDELLDIHPVLDFNGPASSIAAHIVNCLGDSKSKKMWYDIMIVATALAHGHGVASGNTRDMVAIGNCLPDDNNLLQLAIWKPKK